MRDPADVPSLVSQIRIAVLRSVWTSSVLLVSLGVGLLSDEASAAPQTFNTALPVADDEFVFREQFLYKDVSNDPTAADRDLVVIGSVSVLGYAITQDWAVFAVLPILDKELDHTNSLGDRLSRSTRGIGDAQLFGRYTALHDDAPGRTFRIAPFAGIKLPTGDDDAEDRFGRLPPPLQLGSGSWDPFLGVVATRQTLDYQVDVQVAYRANTEANDFEFGDELRFDASLQYRLWPRELGSGVPGFLYGVLETNLIHQDQNRFGGAKDPDSGGTTLLLAPGLQYVTKRWVFEAIVQLPVTQDLNGAALKETFTVLAGFRVNL